MPLDWLGAGRKDTVGELVARRKYPRAIELLQEQIQQQPDSASLRHKLADLLVLAGRGAEAVPVFLELADDLIQEGFDARAVAALKRVEKIEAGRPDVEARFKALAQRGQGLGAPLRRQMPAAAPLPEMGMEEIGEATMNRMRDEALGRALEAADAARQAAAERLEGVGAPREPTSQEAIGEPAVPYSARWDDTAPVPPPPDDPSESPPEPAPSRIAKRIKGALSRLFTARPRDDGAEPDLLPADTVEPIPREDKTDPYFFVGGETPATAPPDTDAAAPTEAPSMEASREALALDDDLPITVEPLVEEPERIAAPPPVAESSPPDPSPAALVEPRAIVERADDFVSMPDDAFQQQVDDLLEALTGRGQATPELLPGEATRMPDLESDAAPSRQALPGLPGLVFDELTDEERMAVLRGLKLNTFEAGDVLVSEGEASGGLFLLTAGSVRLYARDDASRNRPLGQLEEGDFFGEIASLAGLPRVATVVASASGELLELDQATLDDMADRQPRAWARMQAFAREQATRSRSWLQAASGEPALEPSPETGFDPRLRLRVADAFLRAGHEHEALRILVELCDELMAQGQHEKAVALLKKVEEIHERRASGGTLPRRGSRGPSETKAKAGAKHSVQTDDRLKGWLAGLAGAGTRRREEALPRVVDSESLQLYLPRVRESRLFEALDEPSLTAFLAGLALVHRSPGDVLLSEGETIRSVFVVATGSVKAFVRQALGRDALLSENPRLVPRATRRRIGCTEPRRA